MVTILIVIAVATIAVVVGFMVNGRTPDAPTSPQFATPQQLDRADFEHADREWLFVLFSSATCLSCQDARAALAPVTFERVAVLDLPVETDKAVHDRYGIDAVPTVVLADREGVVRWSFLGAPPEEAIRDILVDIGILRPDDGTAVDIG